MKTYSREFEAGLKKAIRIATNGQKTKWFPRKTKRSHPLVAVFGTLVIQAFVAAGARIVRFDSNQFNDAGQSACIGLLLTITMYFGVVAMSQPFEFSPKFPPYVFPVSPARLASVYLQRMLRAFLRCSFPGILAISAIMTAPLWVVDWPACAGITLLLSVAASGLRIGMFYLQVSIPFAALVGLPVCALLLAVLTNTGAQYSITVQHFLNDNAAWINLLHPGGWVAEIWRATVLSADRGGIHWISVPLVIVVGSLFFTLPRARLRFSESFATEDLWGGPASAPSSSVFISDDDDDGSESHGTSEDAAANPLAPNECIAFELPSLPEPVGRWRWIERALWKRLTPRERMLLALELKEMPKTTASFFRGCTIALAVVVILAVLGSFDRAGKSDTFAIAAVCVGLAGGLLAICCFLPFGLVRHVNTRFRPIQDHYPVSYQEITKLWFRGETMGLLLGIPAAAIVLILFASSWAAELPEGVLWLPAFGIPIALYCLRYAALVAGDSTVYRVNFWWGLVYIVVLLPAIALIGISIFAAPAAVLFILLGKGLLRLRVGAWNRGVRFRDGNRS